MTFSTKATPAARLKAVQQLVTELNADTRPILLGPWRSELGFEALYWLPFLTWLAKRVKGFDQRACVVTRGGLAPLYSRVAARGFDLYALRDVKDLRRQNLADHKDTGLQKQVRVTPFDEAILSDAATAMGIGALYHTVHPAWMYWALAPFWEEEAGLKHLAALTDYATLPMPPIEGNLPPEFVAVKFYARATFPYPHPEVAAFVQRTVGILAEQIPVVLLNSSPEFDDHQDIIVTGKNTHSVPTNLPPEQNLAVQVGILARAKAFIGTYGGVAQCALRLGVPSLSVYQQWGGTLHAHLALSSWISKATNVPFLVGSTGDAELWRQVVSLPIAAPQVAPVTEAAA